MTVACCLEIRRETGSDGFGPSSAEYANNKHRQYNRKPVRDRETQNERVNEPTD